MWLLEDSVSNVEKCKVAEEGEQSRFICGHLDTGQRGGQKQG